MGQGASIRKGYRLRGDWVLVCGTGESNVRNVAVVVAVFTVPLVAHAMMWTDPTFEDMVAKSEFIAICKIAKGGPFVCEAEALKVLKGDKPTGQFRVGDYNNQCWPRFAIERETLRDGETVLFFLAKANVFTGYEISPEAEKEIQQILAEGKAKTDDLPELRRRYSEAKHEKIWAVPTPSTGDYRIKDDRVLGGWHRTSYPHGRPGVSTNIAIPLLRGLIAQQSGAMPSQAQAVLSKELTLQMVRKIRMPKEKEDYPDEDACRLYTLEWLLCAQGEYGKPDKPAHNGRPELSHRSFHETPIRRGQEEVHGSVPGCATDEDGQSGHGRSPWVLP